MPAVLLMGISKSGFGAGFGALAVPLMALAMPVPQAAAIMLPLLAVVDGFGLKALWRERERALIRLLLPAGLLGTLAGALLFRALQPTQVAALVGGLTLAFLAIRLAGRRWLAADGRVPPRWLGRVLAATSGFTSFVAHAGGPPLGFYMLPLRLPPLRFTATMAVFFAAINASKWLPYAWLGLLDTRNLLASAVLLPLAPLGVWLGLRIVRVIPQRLFYALFELGMLLTGLKLLSDGLLA